LIVITGVGHNYLSTHLTHSRWEWKIEFKLELEMHPD
jgi:hypothetical protein